MGLRAKVLIGLLVVAALGGGIWAVKSGRIKIGASTPAKSVPEVHLTGRVFGRMETQPGNGSGPQQPSMLFDGSTSGPESGYRGSWQIFGKDEYKRPDYGALDLGGDRSLAPKRITKIRFATVCEYNYADGKLLGCDEVTGSDGSTGGGVVGLRFQAANKDDFSDAADLYTIPDMDAFDIIEEPETVASGMRAKQWFTISTTLKNTTAGYRYFRVVGSSGRLAEVEFYGTDMQPYGPVGSGAVAACSKSNVQATSWTVTCGWGAGSGSVGRGWWPLNYGTELPDRDKIANVTFTAWQINDQGYLVTPETTLQDRPFDNCSGNRTGGPGNGTANVDLTNEVKNYPGSFFPINMYVWNSCGGDLGGGVTFNVQATGASIGGTLTAPSEFTAALSQTGGACAAALSWKDNSSNETGFVIERAVSNPLRGAPPVFQTLATVAANTTSYSDDLKTLTKDSTVSYRVRATNDAGSSDPSSSASVTATCAGGSGGGGGGTGTPAAPTNLALTVNAGNQFVLTWTDASSNETGFEIERTLLTASSWAKITTTAAGATTYTDSPPLTNPPTTYKYRVRAVNGTGASGYSNEVSGKVEYGGQTTSALTVTADKTSYASGETVTLTATNTGTAAISYRYCGGDGNPVITDASGKTVYQAPTAGCPTPSTRSLEVGTSLTYIWNQKSSSGTQVAAGTYTATVALGSVKATASIVIASSGGGGGGGGGGTTQTLAVSPTNGVAPLAVTITLPELKSGVPDPYTLEFGDGSKETVTSKSKQTVKHTYQTAGTYTLKLLYGGVEVVPVQTVASASVTVTAAVASAVLTVSPTSGTAPLGVTATIGSLPVSINFSHSLDWGDGSNRESIRSRQSLKHTYKKAGTYTVKVLRQFFGTKILATVTVTVSDVSIKTSPSPTNLLR